MLHGVVNHFYTRNNFILLIFTCLSALCMLMLLFTPSIETRYCIGANKDGPLVSSSVRRFVEQLGDRTSSPGGGSASACMASMVSVCGKVFIRQVSERR